MESTDPNTPPPPGEPEIVNAIGLKCPLPVLLARKAWKRVAPGGLLVVLATDPGAPEDFVHFSATVGGTLRRSAVEGDHFVIEIERARPADAD